MNDQSLPSPIGENLPAADGFSAGPGTPRNSAINPAESPDHRTRVEGDSSARRRSDGREREASGKSRSGSQGAGRGGRHRSKRQTIQLDHRMTQKLMIGACVLLSFVAVFFLGFLKGKKSAQSADLNDKPIAQEATFPSPDSLALLNTAFGEMGNGDYRKAMIDFQKVHDLQDALTGIDFLIAEAAFKAGENDLAESAAGDAISKNESADEARVLLALINLNKQKSASDTGGQFLDPNANLQTEMQHFAAVHPADAKVYLLWGDSLRSGGSYRQAIDILHQGYLRADPEITPELLSAKEQLARLQNEPAKSAPSLSALTSMSAEQSLVAALSALQQHKSEDAAVFLERAHDLYPPQVFRELIRDAAFADYHADPELKQFFQPDQPTATH